MLSVENSTPLLPPLLPHRDPERLGLPLPSWPEADRTAWQQALAAEDLLSEDGRAAHWASASRRKVASSYGCYLGWLTRRGLLEPEQPVTARLTVDHVSAYLAERRGQVAKATLLSGIADLRSFVRVAYPEHDWHWLAGVEAAIRQRRGSARDKRKRLRNVAELVALGESLMFRGSLPAPISHKNVLAYRDGFMIALLALRPLRLQNFTGLTLGRSLQRQSRGWWICLEDTETKNRRPLELPFPDELVPALEHYLSQIRPRLLKIPRNSGYSNGDALWISLRRTPMSPASIYEQITLHTRTAFGLSINPHMFRDCGVTSLAVVSPSAVRAGPLVLGHTSYATTEKHYNLACAIDAAGRHHAILQTLRGPRQRQSRR